MEKEGKEVGRTLRDADLSSSDLEAECILILASSTTSENSEREREPTAAKNASLTHD